jgi:exopolysaccharide biosynthesis polyprenyl glycosylphosphotransferase
LATTTAAFVGAFWVRFSLSLPIFKLEGDSSPDYYTYLFLLFIPLWLLIFLLNGLYKRSNLLGGTQEYSLVFQATTASILSVIIFGFLAPDFILARGWLLLAWVLSFVFVSCGRFLVRRVIYFWRKRGYFVSNTLIVGANEEGYSLAGQLLQSHRSGLHVLGFVDDVTYTGARVYRHLFNLGNLENLNDFIEYHNIEELILVTSALPREKIVSIFKKYGMAKEVNLRLSSGLYEVVTTGLEMDTVVNVPLVRVNKLRQRGMDQLLKFLLDYAIAIPVLLFLFPLLLALAIWIKIDSPGPAIHRRRVLGKNGREFDAFKFRTMYINGDEILNAHPELKEELAKTHKLKKDPRITKVGRFIRQYSLDELPQLINVLKRQMSIVGPRMITPAEIEMYDKWDFNLMTVNPGLTGLWQVSGRSNTTYDERVRLDMQYIRGWTIWSDLYIIWLTIPAVLRKDGAY